MQTRTTTPRVGETQTITPTLLQHSYSDDNSHAAPALLLAPVSTVTLSFYGVFCSTNTDLLLQTVTTLLQHSYCSGSGSSHFRLLRYLSGRAVCPVMTERREGRWPTLSRWNKASGTMGNLGVILGTIENEIWVVFRGFFEHNFPVVRVCC